jgi:hypothetical protein
MRGDERTDTRKCHELRRYGYWSAQAVRKKIRLKAYRGIAVHKL